MLRESKQADPTIPVILITAFGSIEEAVTAMKDGAFDFIQKPVDLDHLNLLVARAAQQQELLRENLLLREEYTARYGFPRIVGEHPTMQAATQQVQRVAATDSTVLLLGESGTGKELFARAIHGLSARRSHPFVALNCAAIPEGLVENELFGHERGAYTGAGARKIGKMELAHRGTIFLDEIGELPIAIQSKLLRVLEEKRFDRVGGTQSTEVDVRIIAATNKDLHAAVAARMFREDLFFRIAGVPITIPPSARARQRRPAAGRCLSGPISAGSFASPALELTQRRATALLRLSAGPAMCANCKTRWSALQFSATAMPSTPRRCSFPRQRPSDGQMPAGMLNESFSWEGTLQDVSTRAIEYIERFKIDAALRSSKWNKTRAAEQLGVSYKTLLTKIRALGLEE